MLESDERSLRWRASDTLGDPLHPHGRSAAWSSFCMADSTGRELTFGRALVGSLLLVARDPPRTRRPSASIGLLLPGSVGGALANIAASIAGRSPGQPELHRRPRGDGGGDRALRHHDRSSRRARSSRRPASRRCAGHGVSRRRAAADVTPLAKARDARSRRACCRRRCSRGSSLHAGDADVARDDHLLERQHRRARRA